MNNRKTILYKPLESDDLFVKIFNSQTGPTFVHTYQVHSDSIEDFKDVVRHSPNRKYFENNSIKKDLEEGIEIDSELVEIKEFSVPYKTVLNEFKNKVIIPEVVDLACYKEKKLTWDDIYEKAIKEIEHKVNPVNIDQWFIWLKQNYIPPIKK